MCDNYGCATAYSNLNAIQPDFDSCHYPLNLEYDRSDVLPYSKPFCMPEALQGTLTEQSLYFV